MHFLCDFFCLQGHYLLAVALDNLKEYNQAIVSFLHALRYDIKHRDQLADNVAVVASNICHYSEETLQQFEGMFEWGFDTFFAYTRV